MVNQNSNGDMSPIRIQSCLKGVDYPAAKQDLISQARDNDAPHSVMSVLNRLPDQRYSSPVEVTRAMGRAR